MGGELETTASHSLFGPVLRTPPGALLTPCHNPLVESPSALRLAGRVLSNRSCKCEILLVYLFENYVYALPFVWITAAEKLSVVLMLSSYIKAVFLSFLVSFSISFSFPAGTASSAVLRGRPPGLFPAGLPSRRLHPPEERPPHLLWCLHPGPELSLPRGCTPT